MEINTSGVTRIVILTRKHAYKIVRLNGSMGFVRSYLANQSEWKQRHFPFVNPPQWTLLHLITCFPRAVDMGRWEPEEAPSYMQMVATQRSDEFGWRDGMDPADEPQNNEERKGSAWGFFGPSYDGDVWKLIDYDRAWAQPRQGVLCRLYYANEERKARKWMQLPFESQPTMYKGAWVVDEVPCPKCGQYTVIGYSLVDLNGKHQHTRYVCTHWNKFVANNLWGVACGWSDWSVPAEELGE